MNLASLSLPDLLRVRLDQVAQIMLATERLQRQQQLCAAAEMELMRCEFVLQRDEDARAAGDSVLARDLLSARRGVEDAEASRLLCVSAVEEIEAELAETDREIGARARR